MCSWSAGTLEVFSSQPEWIKEARLFATQGEFSSGCLLTAPTRCPTTSVSDLTAVSHPGCTLRKPRKPFIHTSTCSESPSFTREFESRWLIRRYFKPHCAQLSLELERELWAVFFWVSLCFVLTQRAGRSWLRESLEREPMVGTHCHSLSRSALTYCCCSYV